MLCSLLINHQNKYRKYEEYPMILMTVGQVAEFLGVQNVRVERLERESLLPAADKDADGSPLFEKDAVEKYKVLAERLGGL
jgi:hypothetical protein